MRLMVLNSKVCFTSLSYASLRLAATDILSRAPPIADHDSHRSTRITVYQRHDHPARSHFASHGSGKAAHPGAKRTESGARAEGLGDRSAVQWKDDNGQESGEYGECERDGVECRRGRCGSC